MSNKVSKKKSGGGCGCAGNSTSKIVMSGGSCGMGSCPIQLGGRKKTKRAKKSSNKKSKKSKRSNKSRKH
jgi:hypothetical protein